MSVQGRIERWSRTEAESIDRSGCVFFGLLTLLAGVAFALLGLAHLALPFATQLLPELRIDRAIIATGLLTYLTVGVTLILCGLGSIRLRRWTRPAMLTVGWVWLFAGLMIFGYAAANMSDLIILVGSGIKELSPEIESLLAAVVIAPLLLFGCLPPLLLLWIYRDPNILHTCREAHPEPDWSDRCSTELFILALALGYSGLLTLPLALRPTLPWFGELWSGPRASLIYLLLGAFMIGCGWALFQRRKDGWWAAGLLTTLLGLSSALTLYHLPRADWYRALDYPEKMVIEIAQRGDGPPWLAIAAVIALSLVTWIYLLRIRDQFTESSTRR